MSYRTLVNSRAVRMAMKERPPRQDRPTLTEAFPIGALVLVTRRKNRPAEPAIVVGHTKNTVRIFIEGDGPQAGEVRGAARSMLSLRKPEAKP